MKPLVRIGRLALAAALAGVLCFLCGCELDGSYHAPGLFVELGDPGVGTNADVRVHADARP
jgi:hypothetical protein